jgi:hypothetical protein
MLSADSIAKARRQAAAFTDNYRQSQALGYNVTTMGLPSYDTQEDFDSYRPEDAGSDYQKENEFIAEILKGLFANGVPAKAVKIRYADYTKWLKGRENTSSNRASYCGMLIGEEERRIDRSRG